MNIDKIAYFLSIAQEGSFSAAARKHYISQTAVSLQIASLEKELGCVLFLRTSGGVVLTNAGRRLLPLAQNLVDDWQAIKDGMSTPAQACRALTVAYTGPIEKRLLGDAFFVLHRLQAGIELRPRQFPLAQISDALAQGACDVVLSIPSEIPLRQHPFDVVAEYETRAVVSSVSELAERSSVTLSELAQYPLIVLQGDATHNAGLQIHQWALSAGFSETNMLTAESIDTQLFMVSLNQGISLFPDSPAIREKGVRLIPIEDYAFMHQTIAAYQRLTPEIAQLIAALREAATLPSGA